MKKRALLLLLPIGVLWFLNTSLVHVITPQEMTVTAIGESFSRIHIYAKEHRKLPESMADFPQRDGYANRTTDGWGHDLIYEIGETGTITLTSLGADHKPGGTGDNKDISKSYLSTAEDGSFIAGDSMWIVDGELQTND